MKLISRPSLNEISGYASLHLSRCITFPLNPLIPIKRKSLLIGPSTVGDWLKSFIDALSLPVTLLGLPRTQGLLQVNEQLRRRFSHHLSLSIEAGEQEPNEDSSIGLFTSLAEALPLPLNPKPHGWKELGLRLHFATQGRIAYVKQILVHAYSCAVENGNDCITTNELASAFTASIWPAGIGPLNPFDSNFQWRALDRNGEPFQLGDVGTAQPSRRKR